MISHQIQGQPQRDEFIGTGIAVIKIATSSGNLRAYRYPGLLFGAQEPGFNNGLVVDDLIYLYGTRPGTFET